VRAIDTNVLVRLLARDDATQVAAAEAFVQKGALVSLPVLLETVWVLQSVYGVKRDELVAGLDLLLTHESLALQDADVVGHALARFRKGPKPGFPDCLMLEVARKAGHLPLGTFDEELGAMDGGMLLGLGDAKGTRSRAGRGRPV
jgi:predicted nucleic-acid-binding protein